jgi:hypothetical protein
MMKNKDNSPFIMPYFFVSLVLFVVINIDSYILKAY